MATGFSPLECPICAELYDNGDHQPKLLMCHHTLCLSCIIQQAKGNTVKCPSRCKQVTTLPHLSADEQNVTNKKEKVAKRAKKLQYSFYIDIIKESERLQQLVLTQNQTCTEHNKLTEIWCKTCQRVICIKCLFSSHKEHDQDLLENVIEIFQDKLNNNLKQIKTQTQKLQSENASKIKQQYMADIDRQFEQIHKDLTKMLDSKKESIKKQVTLAVDESVNIQVASLDSLSTIYQQAVNSEDILTKVHVSSCTEYTSQLNKLTSQSLTTDDQTEAQIQQCISNIKQGIKEALFSVATPTLSHQLEMKPSCTDESQSEATFRFKIDNILALEKTYSPPCMVRNLPWNILAMSETDGNNLRRLGFFLQCNTETENSLWSCRATAELRLIKNDKFAIEIDHLFKSQDNDWGFKEFIEFKDLTDENNGYIKDGAIELEEEIFSSLKQNCIA